MIIKYICQNCKKEFEAEDWRKRIVCSINCRQKWVGKKLIGHKSFGIKRKGWKKLNAKGHIRKDGRKQIWKDNKNQYEYRLIMEKHLGRKLNPNEIINHKDGNPSNDALYNLEVLTPSEHLSKHHKEGKYIEHLNQVHRIKLPRGDDGRFLPIQND